MQIIKLDKNKRKATACYRKGVQELRQDMRAIKEPVGIFYTLVDADGTTYDYYAFNNEKAAFHMAKNAKLLLDKILSDGD